MRALRLWEVVSLPFPCGWFSGNSIWQSSIRETWVTVYVSPGVQERDGNERWKRGMQICWVGPWRQTRCYYHGVVLNFQVRTEAQRETRERVWDFTAETSRTRIWANICQLPKPRLCLLHCSEKQAAERAEKQSCSKGSPCLFKTRASRWSDVVDVVSLHRKRAREEGRGRVFPIRQLWLLLLGDLLRVKGFWGSSEGSGIKVMKGNKEPCSLGLWGDFQCRKMSGVTTHTHKHTHTCVCITWLYDI